MSAPAKIAMDVPLFAPTPSAPAVTPTGGAAGNYTYKAVAIIANGTHSAVSAGTAIANGPTTLDGTHYNTVDPSGSSDPGATSYNIYRTAGGATQGKIGNVLNDGSATLVDNGLVADGSTAPVTNTTGVGIQSSLTNAWDAIIYSGGTFVGTMQMQVTPDGTTWYNLGSAITTVTSLVLQTAVACRVTMSAYTSGTPTISLLYYRR